MSDKTQINSYLNAVQNGLGTGQATAVNQDIAAASRKLSAGVIFAEKYEVIEPLKAETGEADLYICRCGGKKYVAKMYRRQRAVKQEVLAALKSIDSPYVASLLAVGEYGGLPFVILPYYKNGSLQGRRFSPEELRKNLIPCINEALRVLHQNDIIHKDLKPSNIMLQDDNKSIAIIDFGISSVVEEGNTVLVTQTGMTPEYSAPETFRNLFLEESDYYSFGITVYELFCGHTPYKNMNADEIARYTAVQRIPFPKDMPEKLRDFISGVTYFDITNRNKKNNPNRRWTYNEVLDWCKGKKLVIPGEGGNAADDQAIPPYSFLGRKYKDLPSLITALAVNWSEGKRQLYRGLMSAYFKNFNPEIAGYCIDAEEEAIRARGREDVIFWKLLYKIYPELDEFYWAGKEYESLAALGCDMLTRLWNGDKSNFVCWNSILNNELLTGYLAKRKSTSEDLLAAAAALEAAHAVSGDKERDRLINYYAMAYLLSGRKIFNIGDKKLQSVGELADHMKVLLASSYEEFESFCHKMLTENDLLDEQLEAWLIALGKRQELDSWRQQLA